MSKQSPDRTARADAAKVEAVRDAILAWFEENGRDLPWRRTRDPYRVLVSEVMLQQIQVKRAIPFYLAFLERFPTVEALAAAPLSEAIKVWDDLGRYRRVVSLHRTARIVVEEHGGRIPSDPSLLAKLPGIGPYTAGAVACFAFERAVPFVDTNMRRVLHRVFRGPEVPEPAASEGELIDVAAELVPSEGGDAWAWNQALMELGALVCTARKPRCDRCPTGDICCARDSIETALAGARSASRNKAGEVSPRRYEDSYRFLRGRVLARLREAPEEGVSLRELGAALREGFADEDLPWILGVVRSLEKDGLAAVDERDPSRNRTEAVAETRPAYGTEREALRGEDPNGSLPNGEALVRLPQG